MDSIPDCHEYCTGGYNPDDIVISGIAGRFPECDNVGQLRDALLSKKTLIVHSDKRYEKGACGMPYNSYGLISDIDKLDADFFCVSYPSANGMDPASRKLLEVSYEAMADSGYDPFYLRGLKIGVYNGTISDDAHQLSLATNNVDLNTFLRCMIPNRTSYANDFIGPSYSMDTGCSSTAVALWAAINDMRENRIEAAIVNAAQIDLDPRITAAYIKHGVQSTTENNIPFDASTDGILRTEAAVALFLQKASVARRCYGKVASIHFLGSGHVVEGISVPSMSMQVELTKVTLKEAGVSPDDIDFVEAHGTGTSVGDPIELNAVASAYCPNRKKPLYIGSIKSSIGHPEAVSAACGVVKALIALETSIFSPNLRFTTPNPECQELVDGKIRVVTEPMPLTCPYIPVNSFGFGGTLVQTLLKQNPIVYKAASPESGLPRLVLYPATTEEAITSVFEFIKKTPDLRQEFFALMNKLSFTPTYLKPIRGYELFHKDTAMQIKTCSPHKRPIWFILTGMGCQWSGMGRHLMKINVFAQSMRASAATLKEFNLDLFDILTPEKNLLETHRRIIPAFVSICAIQIALIDVLRSLDIHADGIIGHSTGEVACAYADGCCTAEETLKSAYWRGKSTEESNLAEGAMAAVGLTWDEAKARCPEGVYPACENADDSVTVSGLKENVENFVEKLKKDNVFARMVNAYGYAFHCPCVEPASTSLKPILEKVLNNPKPRSSKWISSSHPESDWEKPSCKIAGADYFVNNLVSKVRFSEAVRKIPADAVVIEIGPHGVLLSVLKRILGSGACLASLMKRDNEDNLNFFFESLGKLYINGVDPKIERLYPAVKFPVPRGTPMISDLIKWNHSQTFHVPRWTAQSGESLHDFKLDKKDSYLMDHRIDGRSLFPATGYILLAWEALASKLQKKTFELPVFVQNFKIHRATIISNQASVQFYVNLLGSSGNFEITEGNSVVASGEVHEWKNPSFSELLPPYQSGSDSSISGADVYNELKMSGYEYGPAFQGLMEMNMDGTQGLVAWRDRWIPFLDSLLLFFGLLNNSSNFCLPTGALSFKIDPNTFQEEIDNEEESSKGVAVYFNSNTNVCRSIGIEISQLSMDPAPHRVNDQSPTLEQYKYIPYIDVYTPKKDTLRQVSNYLQACNKTIDKIGKLLNIRSSDFKFAIGSTNAVNIDEYMENLSDDQQLLKILKEVSMNPNSVKKGRKELFSSYVQNIGKEMLNCRMTEEYPLRILSEIISENSFRKLTALEVNTDLPPVLPSIISIMKKYSYIKLKSSMLVCLKDSEVSQDDLDEHNIQRFSSDLLKTLTDESKPDILISSFLGGTRNELDEFVRFLSTIVKSNGFVLLFFKEKMSPPESLLCSLFNEDFKIPATDLLQKFLLERNFITLSRLSDDFGGSVHLLRSPAQLPPPTILKLTETNSYDWVEKVKCSLSKPETNTLWLVTENDPSSGIIGMVNCLKQEPGGEKIRCIFMAESSKDLPPFNFEHPTYKQLLERNLIMNVRKNGTWGSFRHISIKESILLRTVEHSYVNCKKYGDLSSFEWLESYVKYAAASEEKLVHIYYSALNFKDVMLATGKLSIGTTKIGDTQADDSVLGLEFAGRDKAGRRVAGFIRSRGMATSTLVSPLMCIDVPNTWTLEQAATVPVVYATCYYALVLRARLKRKESILIHSGTGGIGLAAISIAMSLNCNIFTTVGNEEKRKYLKEKFPEIKDENIGCSRDTTFEKMVMERTKGKGVNVVLNSLADDKFQASLRCVARHGRFIEIGKYDLSLDRKIGLKIFLNNITFCGVFLDQLFENTPEAKSTLAEVMQMIKDGIKDKVVKPLDRTVFSRKEIEEAFRYMAKGVHVGKVLIKVREEETENFPPKTLVLPAVPKTYFYSSKVYIVIGGLGGFGIEVTKWILSRGGMNIILTTRYGARTPYHHLCLRRWKKSGYNVQISTLNVAQADEAEKLLKEASLIGPVGGIFNSAVILKDAFMDCQTAKSYEDVCAPKATATKLLDELSRLLCPSLDYFVCFSSVSCGRGNAGQTNYGYANSVMERVCELRRSSGLHGLAIQWGIIGEVGVVHRHMGDDAMIAGVSAQSVKSCLETLDTFCQIKYPVVSSYVNAASAKRSNKADVLTQISKILGMKDISEINITRNFGEMGIDSMVGVEVKQLLENNCDVSLTMQEIFDMKIGDVQALVEKTESENAASRQTPALLSTTSIKVPKLQLHTESIISLNKRNSGMPIYIISIGDTDISDFHTLAEAINQPTFALVWTKDTPVSDMKALAVWYLQLIENNTHSPYHLVGYSLGGSLAIEMALQSEKAHQRVKSVTLLDGSAYLRRTLSKERSNTELEVEALKEFVEQFSSEGIPNLEDQLLKANNLEQRIGVVLNLIISSSDQMLTKSEASDAIANYIQKSKIVASFNTSDKLKKDITLLEDPTQILANDITEMKILFSQICSGKVNIHRIFSRSELSNTEAMKKIASTLNNVH